MGLSSQKPSKTVKDKKAPQHYVLRGFLEVFWIPEEFKKLMLGGNGGIRTLDEALHPILP
jgi:hypothetical protein